MSPRVLGRYLRNTSHHNTGRYYSTLNSNILNEVPKTSRQRLRWYALGGALSASALGLWLWDDHISRQAALRPLSRTYFTPTKLTSSEKTSEDTKLLKLTVPPQVAAGMADFQTIWSIYVKDSDIQVERPYTPLKGISSDGEMIFWIKKYTHGEVGRWLHSRAPGERIEIRGPEHTWTWQDDTWDNVIMIAGGTGIAPFYQLLNSRFSTSKDAKTKFTLLQGYRSPSDLPPPQVLESLSSWEKDRPQQLKVYTFIDSLDGSQPDRSLTMGRISKETLRSVLKKAGSGRTIVLICGPDPMINALAGPRGRDQSQGPIGGVLGSLNDGKFQVWKL